MTLKQYQNNYLPRDNTHYFLLNLYTTNSLYEVDIKHQFGVRSSELVALTTGEASCCDNLILSYHSYITI